MQAGAGGQVHPAQRAIRNRTSWPGRVGRDHARHWRPTAADIIAFGDARIAAVHAGLKLTAEQEKNWPPVESALRDLAKQRSDWFAARASAEKPKDPVERLNLRADVMTKRGAALKKLADAAGPLYKSLDEGQQHRFVMLAKLGGRGGERGEHGQHGGDASRSRRQWKRGPMGPQRGQHPQ